MTAEINLQQFCGDDDYAERREIHRPFSADGFTWAVNGYIAIRVTHRDEFKPQKKHVGIGTLGKIIDEFTGPFTALSQFTLPDFIPTESKTECCECDGRGTEHDCPDCTCKCDECDGTGFVGKTSECSCEIFGAIFNIKYLRMVFALPNVQAGCPNPDQMVFRFDGGDGILMTIRR